MRKFKVQLAICMVSFLVLLAGCAGMAIENQYRAYLTVDQEFTTLLEQFEIWYQAATPEQQAEWRDTIDPLFIRADTLLDQYRMVLLAGESPEQMIAQLKIIKSQLLMELAKRSQ